MRYALATPRRLAISFSKRCALAAFFSRQTLATFSKCRAPATSFVANVQPLKKSTTCSAMCAVTVFASTGIARIICVFRSMIIKVVAKISV